MISTSLQSISSRNLPLQQTNNTSLVRSRSTPATPAICSLPSIYQRSFLGSKEGNLKSRRPTLPSCKAEKNKQQNNKNTAAAANNNSNTSSTFISPSPELSEAIDNRFFRVYLPFAVAAGMCMLFDAADSGDWSRIGVISKETERVLQGIVPIAIGGHAVCALVAGYISKQRGEASYMTRSIKALAAGVVGLVEVILLPEERAFGNNRR
jgi:hypothetical protein